jgi:hypothetical protein
LTKTDQHPISCNAEATREHVSASPCGPETGFWEPINNLASLVKQMLETLSKEKDLLDASLSALADRQPEIAPNCMK